MRHMKTKYAVRVSTMFMPCNTTPSTNSRVFCTSPVTRLKMELEPCTSKKRKLSRCSRA